VSGGGDANRDDLVESSTLSGSNPVEMQIVTLAVLLAASGYACMALVTEVVTVSRVKHLTSPSRYVSSVKVRVPPSGAPDTSAGHGGHHGQDFAW
jgi:hypothetical protein